MSNLVGKGGIVLLALIPALIFLVGSVRSQEAEHNYGEHGRGLHGSNHHLDEHSTHGVPTSGQQDYTIQHTTYAPPDIALLDAERRRLHFQEALRGEERPVILQFIYTTCPGVCPLLSSLMADLENVTGQRADAFRRWSVSVDPEHDTPERLRDYAQTFGAIAGWRLMTGAKADIEALQKSFDAYHDNKMDHEPSTFVWPGDGGTWLRLDGFPTADELLAEARTFIDQAGR